MLINKPHLNLLILRTTTGMRARSRRTNTLMMLTANTQTEESGSYFPLSLIQSTLLSPSYRSESAEARGADRAQMLPVCLVGLGRLVPWGPGASEVPPLHQHDQG